MRTLFFICCVTSAAAANADLTVAKVFGHHAILQRGRPLLIWGTGDPKASVVVSLQNNKATSVVDSDGSWRVFLPPLAATSSAQTLTVRSGQQLLERTDILIGDVWHASGQSNMAMNMAAVLKSLPEVRQLVGTFDQPGIRFLHITDGPSKTPALELDSSPNWTVGSEVAIQSFSATAFFFAAALHAKMDVPIGIIDTSRGGTPIEPFIPESAFIGHPTLTREKELGDNDDLEGIWKLPGGVRARSDAWLPGRLFHSRLSPIKDFAVAGCIWYQGESNCGMQEDPRDYQHKMRALIHGWRTELGNDELPFYFVQLPGYQPGSNWPYLREQQRLAADVPHTGMVVTIDLQDPDIHPANKFDVGNRLARWALAHHDDDGDDLAFSGPLFSKAVIDGSQIVVSFLHADSGLMIANKRGLQSAIEDASGHLNNFEITADGEVWFPAMAEIRDRRVAVSTPKVTKPIAVRYAYSPAAKNCNLFNKAGLPASPFCSRPELLKCDPGIPK